MWVAISDEVLTTQSGRQNTVAAARWDGLWLDSTRWGRGVRCRKKPRYDRFPAPLGWIVGPGRRDLKNILTNLGGPTRNLWRARDYIFRIARLVRGLNQGVCVRRTEISGSPSQKPVAG